MPREKLPARRPHVTFSMFYNNIELNIGIGFYDVAETRPAEIFIDPLKTEGQMAALARDAAVVMSIGLQFGASLNSMHESVNKVTHEYTAAGRPATEAAGLIGAALETLKSERPDLFANERPTVLEYCHPAPGEPSFILLGRDPQAPGLIDLWADVRERLEPDSVKPKKAREIAEAMRLFKDTNPALGLVRTPDFQGMAQISEIEMIFGEVAVLQVENTRLRNECETVWGSYGEMKSENSSLREALDLATKLNNSARNDATSWQQSAVDITDQYTALCDEHQRLKDDHGEQASVNDQNQRTIVELTDKVASLSRFRDFYKRLVNVTYSKMPKVIVAYEEDTSSNAEIDIDGIIRRNGNPAPYIPDRMIRQRDGYDLARFIWGAAAEDRHERTMRWLEEVFEFVQALPFDVAPYSIIRQMSEVFAKPKGELRQEAGGVGFTWLSLCQSLGISADATEADEIARVISKHPNELRRRHQIKVDRGFAMQATRPDGEGKRNPIGYDYTIPGEGTVSIAGGRITHFLNNAEIGKRLTEDGEALVRIIQKNVTESLKLADVPVVSLENDICADGKSKCGTNHRCIRLGCGVITGRKHKAEDTWDSATVQTVYPED